MPEVDARLVASFRAGDVSAYGQLWDRHRRLAYAIARRTDPAGDPDDAVSEAFAGVLAAMRAGGGPVTSFRAYMITAVRRAAIQQAKSRTVFATNPLDDETHVRDLTQPDALEQMAIRDTLAALPARWKNALELVAIHGLDLNDVAARLGISYGAAAILVMRARHRFRDLWHQDAAAAAPPTSV